ncbi:MAG: hypothetical protein JWN46_1296 [Acidimicrobiales bacterium]|nr:hypothetical protein [Acidimicrobiales bacterium]
MKWALLLVLGTGGALVVAASATLLYVRHRLRRRNRVDHRVPNGVPLTWLVDPRHGPRLHRRLVRAGQAAEVVAAQHRPSGRRARRVDPPTIVELAAELRGHAASLDRQLGAASALPASVRGGSVRRLESGVAEVEIAVRRLCALSVELAAPQLSPGHARGLADLGEHIELLTGAHRELAQVDADNGLITAHVAAPVPVRVRR